MAEIFVNGKCYHVTHNRLEKDHNFYCKYDFTKNAHVIYTIEYTTNKAVFDKNRNRSTFTGKSEIKQEA